MGEKKINKVHTCWYFTSLPEYVVVDNCLCQSETFPPPPSSQFSESASRDVHLIKEKSQSAFEGPTRNLLMSSRCLATDALILAPWKIFPGVCSFMHCCTIIKIIKLFPWRKTTLNQRHASNKNTQSSCNHGRSKRSKVNTTAMCLCRVCWERSLLSWIRWNLWTALQSQAGLVSQQKSGTDQLSQRQSEMMFTGLSFDFLFRDNISCRG